MDVDEASVSSSEGSTASSLASYVEPISNSVTLKRGKRSNAGANLKLEIKRYKGEEERRNKDGDDEEFWNQDFFKSDDEEFSEGELSEEDRVDKYDSDFDDSEEEEEVGGEEDEEEEEETGKRKNVYSDPSGTKKRKKYKAQPMIGKKAPPSKTQGTGLNRGLTLGSNSNASGVVLSSAQLLERKEAIERAKKEYMDANNMTAEEYKKESEKHKAANRTKAVVVSDIRTRKSDVSGLRKRIKVEVPEITAATASTPPSPSKKEEKKKKRAKSAKPRITQEELLTECVIRTEPENKKWILGRRRMTDANEQIMQEAKKNDLTNVAWRFTSKGKVGVGGQGMFNSVTFPKVDNVPPILQRSVNTSDVINSMKHNPRRNLVCAVTGGKAKYYDPLTGMGYNDKEGFKVIREKYAKGNMKVGTLSYKVKRGKGGR